MDRAFAAEVARIPTTTVSGVFYRHTSMKVRTLTGSSAGGRWGPPGGYSVLYLGRPPKTVVAEAYRHLVDEIEGMSGDLVGPRRFLSCEVAVKEIVDLRPVESQQLVGLGSADLGGPHPVCQRLGQAAHQLGRHGIIAPAATGLGETLAVFEHHLTESEFPVLLEEEIWQELPADPRVSSGEPSPVRRVEDP
jgi:RES domain-containing protein